VNFQYALVRSGKKLDLVQLDALTIICPDEMLARDTKIHGPEPWRVVKVFSQEENQALEAIATLRGPSKTIALFRTDNL
jgi:hypothetical protein